MRENYLDYFINTEERLILSNVIVEVYTDIAKRIGKDESITDDQDRRDLFYIELEKLFDGSNDDFVITVIGHALTTGIYPKVCGVYIRGHLEAYKGHNGRRYREFAEAALNASLNISKQLVDNDVQFRLVTNLVEVALQCAFKLGIKQKDDSAINRQIEEWVYGIKLKNHEQLSVSKFFFLLPSIHYLFQEKNYRTPKLLAKIDELIEFSLNEGDTAKTPGSQYNLMRFACIFPQAFHLKMSYYQKANDTENEKMVALQLAKTYEKLAKERAETNNFFDLQIAINHNEEAVKILQKYGLKEQLEKMKRDLDNQNEKYWSMAEDYMPSVRIDLLESMPSNFKKQIDKSLEEFSNLDIKSKLFIFIEILPFITQKDISDTRKIQKEQDSFFEVFSEVITKEYNQTAFMSDSEENKENYALFQHIQIIMCILEPFLIQIMKKENCLNFSDIIAGIEPLSKRSHLINKAFELCFTGDYLSALYLLTPQVEYWFREEVYALGGQTSNLEQFPVELSQTLGSMLESEKLKEYLGDDIHWLFVKLMTKEPMNIRNKVAHGLELNDNGYCLYFILVVLKLILRKQSNIS